MAAVDPALDSALDQLATAPAEGTAQLHRWFKELLQVRAHALLPAAGQNPNPNCSVRPHTPRPPVAHSLQDNLCGSRTLPPSPWLVVKSMAKAYPLLLHKEYDVALAEAGGEEQRLDAWVHLVGGAVPRG